MPLVWDYNLKKAKKRDQRYQIWKLTRQISYGLKPGEKINRAQLKKYWRAIKINPARRAMLKNLLWPKKRS
jgi:hypothetical protein